MDQYFKVVSITLSGRMFSAVVTGGAEIEYFARQWTFPKRTMGKNGYGICVFDDIRYARFFMDSLYDSRGGHQLWRCEIDTVYDLPQFVPTCYLDMSIKHVLKTALNRDICSGHLWPDHTVMAKAIMLTELLET